MESLRHARILQCAELVSSACRSWIRELALKRPAAYDEHKTRLLTITSLAMSILSYSSSSSPAEAAAVAAATRDTLVLVSKLMCELVTIFEHDAQFGALLVDGGALELCIAVLRSSSSSNIRFVEAVATMAANAHIKIKELLIECGILSILGKIISSSPPPHHDHHLTLQLLRLCGNVCYGTQVNGSMRAKQMLIESVGSSSEISSILPFIMRATKQDNCVMSRWAFHSISSLSYGGAPNAAQRCLLEQFDAVGEVVSVLENVIIVGDDCDNAGKREDEKRQKEACLFHAVECLANLVFRFEPAQKRLAAKLADENRSRQLWAKLFSLEADFALYDVFCFLVCAAQPHCPKTAFLLSADRRSPPSTATSKYSSWRKKLLALA